MGNVYSQLIQQISYLLCHWLIDWHSLYFLNAVFNTASWICFMKYSICWDAYFGYAQSIRLELIAIFQWHRFVWHFALLHLIPFWCNLTNIYRWFIFVHYLFESAESSLDELCDDSVCAYPGFSSKHIGYLPMNRLQIFKQVLGLVFPHWSIDFI